MIFVRHHEKCAGQPTATGKLTGSCDCKVAPMDEAARKALEKLLVALDSTSKRNAEDRDYFALRLDMLAEQIAHEAKQVRFQIRRGRR